MTTCCTPLRKPFFQFPGYGYAKIPSSRSLSISWRIPLFDDRQSQSTKQAYHSVHDWMPVLYNVLQIPGYVCRSVFPSSLLYNTWKPGRISDSIIQPNASVRNTAAPYQHRFSPHYHRIGKQQYCHYLKVRKKHLFQLLYPFRVYLRYLRQDRGAQL